MIPEEHLVWVRKVNHIASALAWVVVLGFFMLYLLCLWLPASMWLQVNTLLIKHAHVGDAPAVAIAYKVNRPFWGYWDVTVLRQQGAQFTSFCSGHGKTHYEPDIVLPSDLDLNYWAGSTCHLPVGTYQVEADWRWDIFVVTKEVTIRSNIFKIFPVGELIPPGAYQ